MKRRKVFSTGIILSLVFMILLFAVGCNPGENLGGKLMFGDLMGFALRKYISDLDLAIMKDCGVPVKKSFSIGGLM